MVFTSRNVVVGGDAEAALRIGRLISDFLVAIVRSITERPAWIIAKGSITASDIATRALGITRAEVVGQALPGIPLWITGKDSRWPGLPYVVFPGNVGDTGALAEMIGILQSGTRG